MFQNLLPKLPETHCITITDAKVLILQKGWNFPPSAHRRRAEKADVQLHSFLILELDGGEWLASRPRRITPGKEPRYPLNRRAGLHIPVGPGCVDRLVQNIAQSLYRTHYPTSG